MTCTSCHRRLRIGNKSQNLRRARELLQDCGIFNFEIETNRNATSCLWVVDNLHGLLSCSLFCFSSPSPCIWRDNEHRSIFVFCHVSVNPPLEVLRRDLKSWYTTAVREPQSLFAWQEKLSVTALSEPRRKLFVWQENLPVTALTEARRKFEEGKASCHRPSGARRKFVCVTGARSFLSPAPHSVRLEDAQPCVYYSCA